MESKTEVKPAAGALTVLGAGVRYALALLAGREREPAGGRAFAASVTTALRPHFFVFPAGAALVGASGAREISEPWRVAVAALAAGLGWGVGQLLNDLLDVEADRVDAPERPAVRGLLPVGPTAAVGLGLAMLVTAATIAVHSSAALLAVASALLIALYAPAKRLPVLGNLAHAALIATAAWIGAAAAAPWTALAELGAVHRRDLVWAGAVAALYLQANYEKDRAGDARAGYRTLAHLLGVRLSALLRAVAALGLGVVALGWELAPGAAGLALLSLGVGLTLAAALPSVVRGTDASALAGYQLAVHATAALMLAPVVRLSPALAALLGVASALLTRRAFQLSSNP